MKKNESTPCGNAYELSTNTKSDINLSEQGRIQDFWKGGS